MEKEVGKNITERLVHSKYFYAQPIAASGKPFFVFVKQGDYLKGELVGRNGNRNLPRSQSYAMEVQEGKQGGVGMVIEPGQVEEFCANAQLYAIINRNELMHSIIRIIYIGKFRQPRQLHPMKIYRVKKEYGFIKTDERSKFAATPKRRPFRGRGEGRLERSKKCSETQKT